MGAIPAPGEPRREGGAAPRAAPAALLAELKPNTDLAWLVERVARNNLPRVVVSAAAIEAWEDRDPLGCAKETAGVAGKGDGAARHYRPAARLRPQGFPTATPPARR